MTGFRWAEQSQPPPATRVTDVAVTRFEHVFEVEPTLMGQHVTQQEFPNWDTLRIVHSRLDHLDWMHQHFAGKVISGEELIEQLDEE